MNFDKRIESLIEYMKEDRGLKHIGFRETLNYLEAKYTVFITIEREEHK